MEGWFVAGILGGILILSIWISAKLCPNKMGALLDKILGRRVKNGVQNGDEESQRGLETN